MSITKQSDPYRAIVDDLAYSYDGVFDREEVNRHDGLWRQLPLLRGEAI